MQATPWKRDWAGLPLIVGLALLGACSSQLPAKPSGQPAPVTGSSPTGVAGVPDYATKLAEWVEAHQARPEANNRWPEFFDAGAALCGMWDYFTLSDAAIEAAVAQDAENAWRAADPLVLIDDLAYAKLTPELRTFFGTLDKSTILFRLDDLAAPSRFVALRATEPLIATSMPELGRARLGAKICAARMRVMLLDKRPEQAVRSLAHALALGRGTPARGSLIAHMVGQTCWTVAEHEVRIDLLDARLDAATCKSMLEVLSEAEVPDPAMALGGERFFVLDTIDRYFLQEAAERQAAPAGTNAQAPSASEVPRDAQVALANEFFDAAAGLFTDDRDARSRARTHLAGVRARIEDRTNGRDCRPLSMALTAVEEAAAAHTRIRLARAGMRTMLAIEVFRARTGHAPESLAELVPADLDAVPVDPFAGNAPLRYRREAGDGAGVGYVLYSVGPDGEDQGGALPNATSPGPSGRGSDIVINSRNR